MEQCSPEWFEIKDLKLTASEATAIGTAGAGLQSLCQKLVVTHITGERNSFSTKDTERGIELEPMARDFYELENLGPGEKVQQVGFIEIDEFSGCSPDGLVLDDGGLEIKCPNNAKYFDALLGAKINSAYIWQVQMCMLLTERKWWDIMLFNPNYEKSSIITRIEPDLEKQEKLTLGLAKGRKIIEEMLEDYKNINIK